MDTGRFWNQVLVSACAGAFAALIIYALLKLLGG
jgi:hypothetical protein